MKKRTITYDNAVVTVHITQPLNYEKLKKATVKFMLGVMKEKESEVKYDI